jgi:hypothetical protein
MPDAVCGVAASFSFDPFLFCRFRQRVNEAFIRIFQENTATFFFRNSFVRLAFSYTDTLLQGKASKETGLR